MSKDKIKFSIQYIALSGAFRILAPGFVVVSLESYLWFKRDLTFGSPKTTEKDNMYVFRSINDAKRAIGRYCKKNNSSYKIICPDY